MESNSTLPLNALVDKLFTAASISTSGTIALTTSDTHDIIYYLKYLAHLSDQPVNFFPDTPLEYQNTDIFESPSISASATLPSLCNPLPSATSTPHWALSPMDSFSGLSPHESTFEALSNMSEKDTYATDSLQILYSEQIRSANQTPSPPDELWTKFESINQNPSFDDSFPFTDNPVFPLSPCPMEIIDSTVENNPTPSWSYSCPTISQSQFNAPLEPSSSDTLSSSKNIKNCLSKRTGNKKVITTPYNPQKGYKFRHLVSSCNGPMPPSDGNDSNVNKYRCSNCCRDFTTKFNMIRHRKTIHP